MKHADPKLLDNGHWRHIPTADIVAVAVVAASREIGVRPNDVVRGFGPWVDRRAMRVRGEPRQDIKRARFYAALALTKTMPEVSRTSIARMLGVRAAKTYMRNAEIALETGRFRWWDPVAFDPDFVSS